MHLQQTTFENSVAKGEIAHNEQFHLLPQYFQLDSANNLIIKDIFYICVYMISKLFAANILLCGKQNFPT